MLLQRCESNDIQQPPLGLTAFVVFEAQQTFAIESNVRIEALR